MIYVCSDIHGRVDRYYKAVNKLKPADKLYILGDVIDRHEGGMDILIDILQRDNVELLLGNHEDMMYRALLGDESCADIWFMKNNGGLVTFKAFTKLVEEGYDKLYSDILSMIENSYLYKIVSVGDKKYYLSHGCAIIDEKYPYQLLNKEADYYTRETVVWKSPFRGNADEGVYKKYKNITFVSGHVIIQSVTGDPHILKWENKIDVDGGCAMKDDYGNSLILYCLDNQTVQYIR